jgi:hypothetical protein
MEIIAHSETTGEYPVVNDFPDWMIYFNSPSVDVVRPMTTTTPAPRRK